MTQIIAVVSGKGGAGKSFFCANMALALAKRGNSCLIIDTDSGMRNIDIIFGRTESIIFDLSDVAERRCNLVDAVYSVHDYDNLYIIAGSKDPDFVPEEDFLRRCCSAVSSKFDYIFIDSPAGIGNTVRNVIKAADSLILITNPMREAVIPASAVSDIAYKLCPKKEIRLVVNKLNYEGYLQGDMHIDEIVDTCHARLLGVVYESLDTDYCKKKGLLLSELKTKESVQLNNIAERISGDPVPLSLR